MPAASFPVRTCRFGPLDLAYDERVLVPRAWTLEQSRWAATAAADAPPGPLLELCAGVGHIGLAAAVIADRDLVQIEVDPIAASFAVVNAARAGFADRVQVRVGSLEEAVRGDERFPLVIADPPYLPSKDVGRFPDDPRRAIDGGDDGLTVIRTCLVVADRHLVGGGALVLQVAGPAQAELVVSMAIEGPGALRPEATRVVDDERAILLLRRTG